MPTLSNQLDNKEICAEYCATCPTYTANHMGNAPPPHLLFCAHGKSACAVTASEKGCRCEECPVYKKDRLSGGWFCLSGVIGKKD
jgi:hypothetical protein